MLVLTSPRTHRRPQWPFGINWASRQAEGLEVWVPFVNGYGVVLTKGGSLGRPTVSTPKFRADGLGDYGIDFNGTDGNAADFPYPDAPLITSAGITIVWTGIVDTTSDYRHFAGKHEFGGGTNNPFEFRTGPGTTQLVLVRANAGGHQEMVGSSLTAGKYHTLAVRVSDNLIQTLPDFFVDGTKTAGTAGASSGTPTGAVTGTSQNILSKWTASALRCGSTTVRFPTQRSRRLATGARAGICTGNRQRPFLLRSVVVVVAAAHSRRYR
jgi:hypothetical protein